jgi:hypothetical protein
MTETIRITHNQQALPISQGEDKSLVLDQDLSKDFMIRKESYESH